MTEKEIFVTFKYLYCCCWSI